MLYPADMLTFAQAAQRPPEVVGAETHRLAQWGVGGLVVLPEFEEAFYRHGNLPEQLSRLLRGINPARIDEDALEGLAQRAQALIRTTYLMDDAVQQFYRALERTGLDSGEVHVRRPGTRRTEGALAQPPGMQALHALKRLWAADWSFEDLLARLDDSGSVALEARPTLLLSGPPGAPDEAKAAALGAEVALVNSVGLVGLP